MIKVSILLTRRADLARDEFSRYWKEKHAPFLLGLDAFRHYVRRYTQQHPLEVPDGLPVAPHDGLAELWFEDLASALEAFGHETYTTAVIQDEQKFVDRAKTVMMLTDENSII